MLMFYLPEDQDLLAALGKVALRHEQLNHALKMTIRSFTNITPQEVLDATQHEGTRTLRERIKKLAKKRLGEGEALLKLQALLVRAGRLTDKRNELTHSVWSKELDGEASIQIAPEKLHPIPTVGELEQLAEDIKSITDELIHARFDGYLRLALDNNPGA